MVSDLQPLNPFPLYIHSLMFQNHSVHLKQDLYVTCRVTDVKYYYTSSKLLTILLCKIYQSGVFTIHTLDHL